MLRFRKSFVPGLLLVVFAIGIYSQPNPEDSQQQLSRKTMLQTDFKVDLIYGGNAPADGHWYGLSPPTWGANKAGNASASKHATHYDEVIIPKGTTIHLGEPQQEVSKARRDAKTLAQDDRFIRAVEKRVNESSSRQRRAPESLVPSCAYFKKSRDTKISFARRVRY
jgi:hypothetical protein